MAGSSWPSSPSTARARRATRRTRPRTARGPRYWQVDAPGITVVDGDVTGPNVGETMYATNGNLVPAWFTPAATSFSWQWLRCESASADCNEIPGATARSYKLAFADGDHTL